MKSFLDDKESKPGLETHWTEDEEWCIAIHSESKEGTQGMNGLDHPNIDRDMMVFSISLVPS